MTSNEIATRDEQQPTTSQQQANSLPAPAPTEGTTALMQWAQEADLAYQMAQKLAATSFVPQSLRGKPGDITAAILAGSELGLKPMATLKSIDIIQGTPALRAHAMRAIVQKQGHEIELVESTDTRCVMRGRRKGSENWQTIEWTIERAQRMGLLGKDQWKKNPKGMLIARATGELCRLIASDALHGMPYAAEELEGITHAEIVTTGGSESRPKAPLSISALTAPTAPASEQTPIPAAESTYSVELGHLQPAAGDWDQGAIDDSIDWQPDEQ